ncbi:P1 family peptidase [Halotalea alkalilenta]|uniref:Peptidase S58 n=1 Tax=Halotalea alkalilenta TaxID=376489 RepID=A0A172YDJ4_9GAMM|nr:P1 family peptidase [Halotalea alkalilenta]ANF57340.1 peptidase S58 [Halotalea alkalilenta]
MNRAVAHGLIPGSITDVPGIEAGHHTLSGRPTGCTVVLCEQGAVAAVDVRGGAPGSRETALLDPANLVERIHAVVLSGGSAYGLDSAGGVMRWLESRGIGFPIGSDAGMLGRVPIVCGAVLMDLGVGDFSLRPDIEAGWRACEAAGPEALPEGNLGAGAGATVGKLFGAQWAMKGGFGGSSWRFAEQGWTLGVAVAVNAVGDVRDPRDNRLIAGARDLHGLRDSQAAMFGVAPNGGVPGGNTTIGVVATDAPLSRGQAGRLAQMAQDGYARAISPIHTPFDGDTLFALSTAPPGSGEVSARELTALGSVAATLVAHAIARAVLAAEGLPEYGLPAARDLPA